MNKIDKKMSKVFGELGKFKLNRLKNSNLRAENIRAIASMCQNAYLGNYQNVCKILGRFNIYVDTRDRTIGIQLLMNGYWEIDITECISRNVKSGMNVIDIGSNYGYFSLLMAGLIGNRGSKVYSIEANPNIYSLLKSSIRSNGFKNRIKSYNLAVVDEGVQDLYFNFRSERSMNGHLDVYKNKFDDETSILVKADKLDNIIPSNKKIDFIKVDIEGAEHLFWLGSKRIRDDNPNIKILIEFNAKRYKYAEQFIDSILDEGFTIKQINRTPDLDVILSKQQLLDVSTKTHVMLLLER